MKTAHQASSAAEAQPGAAAWQEQYAAIQARARLAEQLLDASIDCVMALDREGRILHWNQTCMHFSGLLPEQALGRLFFEVFPGLARNPAAREGFRQVMQGYKVFLPLPRDLWLSGHFELHLVPLSDAADTVTGTLLIAHDVAHRALAELTLKELNLKLGVQYKELERANAELATFTRITGQDLKEPLRSMYSILERLVMEEGAAISPKGRAKVRKVQSAMQRLGLLADSLTTFSQLQPERTELIDLNQTLREVTAQLQPLLREQEATVQVDTLPRVQGDRQQLHLLFRQLLSNGVKFQKGGSRPLIRVRAARLDRREQQEIPGLSQEREYWCILVQDNGIGIPEADRERIFQLFEKGQQEERYAGTGVGLALAKRITENHGGGISVSAAPGGGSIFTCYLPATA